MTLTLPLSLPSNVQAVVTSILKRRSMTLQPKTSHEALTPKPKKTPAPSRAKDFPQYEPGTPAIILTLPSIEMSGQARKNLAPLKVYTCTTVTGMTKGGNYQVAIDALNKDGLRIPAEAMVFPGSTPTPEKLAGAEKIFQKAAEEYSVSFFALL